MKFGSCFYTKFDVDRELDFSTTFDSLFYLVTLATSPVSFSTYCRFLCKIFTNFPPIRYVYEVKSTYFVEKNDIYLIKSNWMFTSSHRRIFEI